MRQEGSQAPSRLPRRPTSNIARTGVVNESAGPSGRPPMHGRDRTALSRRGRLL